ncbi:MAG: hypothetical protein M1817_001940 [Caeruleum heppii]|nr:MAG: hypothetical protein M1817_001940 [Caeruleum heppii]
MATTDTDPDPEAEAINPALAAAMGFASFGHPSKGKKRKFGGRGDGIVDGDKHTSNAGPKTGSDGRGRRGEGRGANTVVLGRRRQRGFEEGEKEDGRERVREDDGPRYIDDDDDDDDQGVCLRRGIESNGHHLENGNDTDTQTSPPKESSHPPPLHSLPAKPTVPHPSTTTNTPHQRRDQPSIQPPGENQSSGKWISQRNGVWQGDEGGYFHPSFVEDPWEGFHS